MSTSKTENRRSTFLEKISWGAGGLTEGLTQSVFALAFPIFSIGLGVSPFLIGIANGAIRFIDAITDPVMGNITDNARTRWGRRRPFIFAGAILLSLLYPLIWMPSRNWSEGGLFAWFFVLTGLFFVAYTIWGIPWSALGLELSDDYNDRTRIQIARMVFSTLSGLGVSWIYKICFFFDPDEIIGVRKAGWVIAGILLVGSIVSAFFVKEWRSIQKQPPIALKSALKVTLSNKPFLLLCASILFYSAGFIMTDPLLLYVNIYHVYDGARDTASTIMGVSGTVGVILALVMLPVGGWASEKFGKRRTALIALTCIIVGRGSLYWLVTPASPYLQLISRAIYQPGNILMWALIPAMIADICDLDELKTGRRREASFGSVYHWVWKCGATLAAMLSGVLLSLVGATAGEPNAMLSAEVILRMRLILGIVPVLLGCIAFLCIWRFPVTQAQIEDAKRELEIRKQESL